jgi:glycosyltransferase involved in cell wall biosynthesis
MHVSVVVPAYNEAGRVSAVLQSVVASELVDEVIVVDDGSEDGTADEARGYPVRVVSLPENLGKAAALDAGIHHARNDVFLFLDADLVGLRQEHVDRLIRAYESRQLDMVVGVFSSGRANTDLSQKLNPAFSGQRMLSRSLWERAKASVEQADETVAEMQFGIEAALSRLAAKEGWRQEFIKLEGVTHVLKEEKRGLARGILARFKMYGNMLKWLLKRF